MKYNVIVSDPPWSFDDKLKMSSVKRGAEANYKTLSNEDIKNLDVGKLAAKDSLLALWVPSSLLDVGLDIMNEWGFTLKQTFIWVKTKKEPLKNLNKTQNFSIQDILGFGMGRTFRNTHEIVLIGTRGKISKRLRNKSCRSVFLAPIGKHSEKPEGLQDMLDLMFPGKYNKKIEMFARRDRPGWVCIGNQAPATINKDIRESIKDTLNENSAA
jgi:N6-adenosine-specific RNA methylase IME4